MADDANRGIPSAQAEDLRTSIETAIGLHPAIRNGQTRPLADAVLAKVMPEVERVNALAREQATRAATAEAEVARLRAGEADEPPASGVQLTPAEWIRKWNDAAPDRRLHAAERVLGVIDQESRCVLMDHDGRLEEADDHLRRLREAQLDVSRLREKVAWADFTAARGWWNWPLVQWWWYRQYKRRDRRAFERECAEIQDRAARGGQ